MVKRSKNVDRDSAAIFASCATAQPILAAFAQPPALLTRESDGAEGVWRAVQDSTGTLRFPVGADAVALAQLGK